MFEGAGTDVCRGGAWRAITPTILPLSLSRLLSFRLFSFCRGPSYLSFPQRLIIVRTGILQDGRSERHESSFADSYQPKMERRKGERRERGSERERKESKTGISSPVWLVAEYLNID